MTPSITSCPQCAGAGTVRVIAAQVGTLTTYYEMRCPTCRGCGVKSIAKLTLVTEERPRP